MRRFYQESWQGIPFTIFPRISFFRLAEPRFYAAFYEELFRRYQGWDDLPARWRANKIRDAEWLIEQIRTMRAFRNPADGPLRVLSIGSGVGFMEKLILDALPDLELYVNEPSTISMRWIRKFIPVERIFIGLPPDCLPADISYDMIYLSAVDYGIPTRELERLFDNLRGQLDGGGELICLSASLLEEDTIVGSLVNSMKNIIRIPLHYLGIRRQQFWGWRRTRKEYERLFRQAGFADISTGELGPNNETFWIRGHK